MVDASSTKMILFRCTIQLLVGMSRLSPVTKSSFTVRFMKLWMVSVSRPVAWWSTSAAWFVVAVMTTSV